MTDLKLGNEEYDLIEQRDGKYISCVKYLLCRKNKKDNFYYFNISISELINNIKKTKKLEQFIINRVNGVHFVNMIYHLISNRYSDIESTTFELNGRTLIIPKNIYFNLLNIKTNEKDYMNIYFDELNNSIIIGVPYNKSSMIMDIITTNWSGMNKSLY